MVNMTPEIQTFGIDNATPEQWIVAKTLVLMTTHPTKVTDQRIANQLARAKGLLRILRAENYTVKAIE
jgi:hypothetical protein